MEQEFELDERMTNETKKFVISSLKIVRPSQVPKLDINLSRKARAANTAKLLANLNFENLKSREVFVKNSQDGHEIPISIHVPDKIKPDAPITVFFHGGGWTFGSRASHYHPLATLAVNSGTIWVSVEYRLAPENKFDIQISDCKSVVEWVVNNKKEIGFENSKVGISGDSAGGHFAAIVAHEHKHEIDYQILIYPCVDLITEYETLREFNKECYILTPELIHFFVGNFLNDYSEINLPRVSPLFYENFSNLPKCLIIAAELDPLAGNSYAYHNKLVENSIECYLKLVKGTIHGFFHNGVFLKEAFAQSVKHILEFLEKL